MLPPEGPAVLGPGTHEGPMSVPSPGSALAADRRPSRIAFLALATLALTLVYTAWLGDDCYFTLRTVQNFLAGEGLRWNRFERVQAYTHPLWMFLLSGAIGLTGEHYLTTIAVGLACTLAASAVLFSAIGTREGRWVAALLLLSRAFVDYGTSGLENPLSYLLAALFLRELLREDPTPRGLARLALWGALACVTRLDTVLLYLPALALRALALVRPAPGRLRAAGRAAGALALGFAPLVAWELFSCFYYGFPFPNTAYAKLGTGIPRDESLRQGLHYLADSLRRDPPTLAVIVLACGLALGRGRRRLLAPAAGVALYVAYVVSIGGDFMSGRFLALPFFVAAGLLGTGLPTLTPAMAQSAVLAAFGLGLHLHQLPLVLRNYEPRPLGLSPEMNAHGIDDERFCVYDEMGLLRPDAPFRPEQDIRFRVVSEGVVFMLQGRQAFAAGPEAIAVETWGLADPLLARLPPRYTRFWRIGHFERILLAATCTRSGRGRTTSRTATWPSTTGACASSRPDRSSASGACARRSSSTSGATTTGSISSATAFPCCAAARSSPTVRGAGAPRAATAPSRARACASRARTRSACGASRSSSGAAASAPCSSGTATSSCASSSCRTTTRSSSTSSRARRPRPSGCTRACAGAPT